MMLTTSNVVGVLKNLFPDIKFFNGCISKHEDCVGVYARGNVPPPTAIGSKPSYGILPIVLLVHYSESSDVCERVANRLYEGLEDSIETINDTRVIVTQLIDSAPANIGRDDNNICEMTIRLNITYERK